MPACGWEIGTWPAGSPSATTEQKADAEALAASVLWALSGRVFGVCEETVHPQVSAPQHNTYDGPDVCRCITRCHCVTSLRRVHLPGPVQSITEVRVDGVVLDDTKYEVHNKRWLSRTDGERWPVTAGDPTALTVTYMCGVPIPDEALAALGELAAHYLKDLVSTGKCSIPARASSVSRQGVEIQLIDEDEMVAAGLTGVDAADRWLGVVNPGQVRRSPSRCYSVDMPEPIRVG